MRYVVNRVDEMSSYRLSRNLLILCRFEQLGGFFRWDRRTEQEALNFIHCGFLDKERHLVLGLDALNNNGQAQISAEARDRAQQGAGAVACLDMTQE